MGARVVENDSTGHAYERETKDEDDVADAQAKSKLQSMAGLRVGAQQSDADLADPQPTAADAGGDVVKLAALTNQWRKRRAARQAGQSVVREAVGKALAGSSTLKAIAKPEDKK